MRSVLQGLGDAAESRVVERLEAEGWTMLGRQVRVGRSEIDVIAIDPGPPRQVVVIEVRWRARRDYGLAEETVDDRKRGRLHRAAFRLAAVGALPDGTSWPSLPIRFDLVVVEPNARLRHYRHGA